MYTPDSSVSDAPLNPDALHLLSFYTMLASVAFPNNPPSKHAASTSASSAQTPNSSPLPKVTITVDTSTNILGHGNTVQLPSPAVTNERIKHLLEIAFCNLPDRTSFHDDEDEAYASPAPADIEIKVQAGVNICGSKNAVVSGGGGLPLGLAKGVKRKADGVSDL